MLTAIVCWPMFRLWQSICATMLSADSFGFHPPGQSVTPLTMLDKILQLSSCWAR